MKPNCFIGKITVPGDNDKHRLLDSVAFVAGEDEFKAAVLASYFTDKAFIDGVCAEAKVSSILDVNANKLRSKLKKKYEAEHKNLDDLSSKNNAEALKGFKSFKAKHLAISRTADIILRHNLENLKKLKNERKSKAELIRAVKNEVVADFEKTIKANLYSALQLDNPIELEAIKADIKTQDDIIRENQAKGIEIKKYQKTRQLTNNEKVELKNIIDNIKKANAKKLLILQNAIEKYGTDRAKNFSNFVTQIMDENSKWLTLVFEHPKTRDLSTDFAEAFEEEDLENVYLGDDSVGNSYDESKNEEYKRFQDDVNKYKSYLQLVDGEIKMYINSLYNRTTSEYDATMSNLDRNNELGVPTTMNAGEVICALTSQCSFYSVEDFISTAEKLISSKESLYGISEMLHRMKQDREFANRIFTSLANPVIRKIMINLTSRGINVSVSNEKVDPLVTLTFSLTNAAKSTIYNSYSIKAIDNLKTMVKSLENKNDDFLQDDANGENGFRQNIRDAIVKEFIKYFPSVKINAIDSYLNNGNTGVVNRYKSLLNDLISFNDEASKIINRINNNAEDGKDYANIRFEDLNYPVRKIAEKLAPYTHIRIELNSTNAKGNMSSDLMANNQITNILKQINYSNEESENAGLEKLKDFIAPDGEIIPQYEYSPILFGIYDENGNELAPGLFVKNGTSITINDKAKDVILCSLFDGVKDEITNTGELYSTMSKGDYFLSCILAYNSPIRNDINSNKKFKQGGYFMRIPSDAPKNFIVHAPSISIDGLRDKAKNINKDHALFRGFKAHLYNELNSFVHNLNNVYDVNSSTGEITLKDNIDGLFDRYHHKDGVLFENGKLTGNVFSFNRLFEIGEKNYDELIKDALSIYGGTANSLIDKNGNINLNRTDLVTLVGDKLTLSLNDETKAALDNIVADWVNNFITEINTRSSEYTALLEGTDIDSTTINEAILNTSLAYMNFDDLFEGDSKFYKNTQDFLKRAKEVQAGGKTYDCWSANDALGETIHNITDFNNPNAENNEVTFEVAGTKYNARNGFRAVTIKNTVKDSVNLDSMRKELREQNVPEHIVESIVSKYKGTKVNDAQSYITIEEFAARRFADGTLSKYKPLLDKLMSDKELTEQDWKEISEMGINIQVEKNFYFDKQLDKKTKVIYPRQIKNAEFVLIPKLLPKDSSLYKLYKYMDSHDIGQVNTVETDKAAKRSVLEFWDNKGEVSAEAEKKFDNDLSNEDNIENYYYRYLYKQQSVAQHLVNAQNKAGIQVIKKILDNAAHYSENVRNNAEKFTNNYIANIRSTFNELMDDLGWKVTDNGEIVNKDSNKPLLDFRTFYDMAKREAIRLGMDTNFLEYFKYDESGRPIMPNFMNNVSSKIESIAQSIFNSSVTRQKLPGWHAAQITSVGYNKKLKYHEGYVLKDGNSNSLISDEEYNNLSEEDKAKYIKAYYSEILLPKWNDVLREMPDDEALAALQEAGLDEHIGYRIPTEGKQSVSILKVAGFLDNTQGSTVMVPDAWVAQTGSDFDVDSVYGIAYEFYRNKQGKLVKYKLNEGTEEKDIRDRYNDYVKRRVKEKFNLAKEFEEIDSRYKDIKKKIEESVNKVNEIREENNFDELQEESKYYLSKLDNSSKNIAYDILNDKSKKYIDRLKEISAKLNVERLITNDTNKALALRQYISTVDSIINLINAQSEATKSFKEFEDFKKWAEKEREDKRNNFNKSIEEAAKAADLVSYEEFKTWDILDQNSKEARNNAILDAMIDILKDPSTREENYASSNFVNLSDDKKVIDNLKRNTSASKTTSKSVYNPFDQIDFMENAMSGAALKAKSVTRDTFNSVTNYTQSTLTDKGAITVEYAIKADNESPSFKLYNINDIESAYSNREYLDKNRKPITDYNKETDADKVYYIRVKHNQLAHSNNGRNVVGQLVTIYSSQTTAHILDAIKEGAIHNENLYTFGAFKTLIDLGIDYRTAIAFLQQPIMDTVVRKYNEQKSVYTDNRKNPIKEAIVDIAKKLGISEASSKYISYNKVYTALQHNRGLQKAFRELFGAELDLSENAQYNFISLNGKLLEARFNRPNSYRISTNNEVNTYNQYRPVASFNMNYDYGYQKREGITANNTLDAIINKERTATTRYAKDGHIPTWSKLKTGDVIEFKRGTNKVLVRITKPLTKLTQDTNVEEWSKKEGWSKDRFEANVRPNIEKGAYQIEFEYITDNTVNENINYNLAAYDLGMLLFFKQLQQTTKGIENTARCSNPDKFGAKQDVAETRETLFNIKDILTNTDNPGHGLIEVNGIPFLQAIYPGIEKGDKYSWNVDVNNSSYKSLAAFLKYSTIPSIKANSQLLSLERKEYVDMIEEVQTKLGIRFNPEQRREYTKYLVSSIYNNVSFFSTPQTVDADGHIIVDESREDKYDKEQTTSYWDIERSRIMGYRKVSDFNIFVKDLNNPTKEELDEFNELTPLQKVLFIQKNFDEGKGISEFLTVNTYNGVDTIKYYDQTDNIEQLYASWNSSFFNKNPFGRLTAIDLIKYAFVVEGFNYKKGAITKLITNNSLYSDVAFFGTGLINDIVTQFNMFANPMQYGRNEFIEKFIRSHSDYARNVYINKKSTLNILKENSKNETITINIGDAIGALALDELKYDINKPKDYVNITLNYTDAGKQRISITTLYKIKQSGNYIFLYPLSLLDSTETTDYSVNPKNNTTLRNNYYELYWYNFIQKIENPLYKTINLKNEDYAIKALEKVNNELGSKLAFINNLNSSSATTRQVTKTFVDDIIDRVQSPVKGSNIVGYVVSGHSQITKLIPGNIGTVQDIEIDGETRSFLIQEISMPERCRNIINNQNRWGDSRKRTEVAVINNPHEARVARDIIDRKSGAATHLYRVMEVNNEEAKTNSENILKDLKDNEKERKSNIKAAGIDFIGSEGDVITTNEVDDLNKAILSDIITSERRLTDIFDSAVTENTITNDSSKKFMNSLRRDGIDGHSLESIHNNATKLLIYSTNFYERSSARLNNLMNKFEVNGESYSIDDPRLYEALVDNPEAAEELVTLLLEANSFGRQISDFVNNTIITEDEELSKSIERIKNAIHKVNTNPKLKKGFELFYNNYIATTQSTNPLIKEGIVKLRDAFGDIGMVEQRLSDITELDISQIQAVVKGINSRLTQFRKFDIPEALNNFREEYRRIESMSGELDMSKVVDKNGFLAKDYNEQFIKDKEIIDNNYLNAKDNYEEARRTNNPNTIKQAAITYYKEKLKRDKWYAQNVEQPIVKSYYDSINALTEEILNVAPEEYADMMELYRELYDEDTYIGYTPREEMERRRDILNKIGQIASLFDEELEAKSEADKVKAKAIQKFLREKRILNNETFEYNATDEYEDKYEYYLNFIREYDASHPNRTLEQKLYDDKYYQAYTWIESNVIHELNEESKTAIMNAFSILGEDAKEVPDYVKDILNKNEYYDDNGKFNPTKVSLEDIKEIKRRTEEKYKRENNEDVLLKNNNPIGRPQPNKEYKEALKQAVEEDALNGDGNYLAWRNDITAKINKLLEKCCKRGEDITPENIYGSLSIDELKELGSLYFQLTNPPKFGEGSYSAVAEFLKNNTNLQMNDDAADSAENYIASIAVNSDKELLLNIFFARDANGDLIKDEKTGEYKPNKEIFGYRVPVHHYIDSRKTEAKKLIAENIEWETIPEFYEALNNAPNRDEFWEANHFYNPYTGEMEVLRMWRKMKIKSTGTLDPTVVDKPSFANSEKNVKQSKRNTNYNRFSKTNYNSNTGRYNNTSLNAKEKAMRDLFQSILDRNATTNEMKRKAAEGFMPRRAKVETDAKWYAKQARGIVGFEFGKSQPEWTDEITYENEKEPEAPMMQLLKQKGYKDVPKRRAQIQGESREAYEEYLKEWAEEKEKIEAENLKLDNAILDKDWKNVFEDYISRTMDYNAKRNLKNHAQLLMEDLKRNKAYKVNYLGNLSIDKKLSSDEVVQYGKEDFTRALKVVETWYHRLFRDEFHQKHKFRPISDTIQNMTSAKYMIFNVTGGIANIGTGLSNMMLEVEGGTYLDRESMNYAISTYLKNIPSTFRKLYSEQATTLPVAIMKAFDVVDFDAMLERKNEEGIYTKIQRFRNALYGLQSGGEHFMQNTILLGVLHSHRLFYDPDKKRWVAGSFEQFNRQKEIEAFEAVIADDNDMKTRWINYKNNIKNDINLASEYATLKKDLVSDFINTYFDKELKLKYIAKRKEVTARSKEEFNRLERVDDQFELVDGMVKIKQDSKLSKETWSEIRDKVISINKKIHGVYDKIGAAYIEKLWFGSLLMQYHKHIWPGIMKRWRRKGYYNETRQSWEKGYYWSLIDLFGMSFKNARKDRYGDIRDENLKPNEKAMQYVATVLDGGKRLLTETALNYKTLPEWEKANVRRCISEVVTITVGIVAAIALHAGWDDDEIKDSATLSTMLYQCDRLVSETSEFTGIFSYASIKTTYSRPVAALSALEDYTKLASNIWGYLFDPTYSDIYDRGQYKGESKIKVATQRIIPGARVYQRLTHISESNKKFSIGKNLLGFIDTRGIGYAIAGRPDDKERGKKNKQNSKNSIFDAMD